MTADTLHQIIDNASLSDGDKDELRRIVDHGLSTSEQETLAEQMREDPDLLYQLNRIMKKKEECINDPAAFDEVLDEEEKLLARLK